MIKVDESIEPEALARLLAVVDGDLGRFARVLCCHIPNHVRPNLRLVNGSRCLVRVGHVDLLRTNRGLVVITLRTMSCTARTMPRHVA
jgi:hypothetical protein